MRDRGSPGTPDTRVICDWSLDRTLIFERSISIGSVNESLISDGDLSIWAFAGGDAV